MIVPPVASPPLVAGQRLDSVTFHERYERMPPNTRAELIGGVVYMPSPLSLAHGDVNAPIVTWLSITKGGRPASGRRSIRRPGWTTWGSRNPTARSGSSPNAAAGRRPIASISLGPPELVVEIARSSRAIDLGPKLQDYQRTGVLEYLVVALEPDEVFWFERNDDLFTRVEPDADGVFRSEVFPGLWLDSHRPLPARFPGLMAVLGLGLDSAEHAAFVDHLARVGG